MGKRKFDIVDEHGESVGFVVIEQDSPTMQHVARPGPAGGPAADATLFVVVLGGFTAAAWLLPGPDWLPPAVGITLTATLAGLKAWRGAPAKTDNRPGPDRLTIQVESWPEHGGPVLLDEVKDKTIGLQEWRKVAQALDRGCNFSRPALAQVVSQTTWHKVKTELIRLNMAHRDGNNYVLSPRGKKFLKKLSALP